MGAACSSGAPAVAANKPAENKTAAPANKGASAAPAPKAAPAATNGGAATAATNGGSKPAADYPPHGLSKTVQGLPEWIKLGCGDTDYICAEKNAIFPARETPADLPDLSKHGNLCANALRDQLGDWYSKNYEKKTSLGVPLAACIKTGIDNPGHPHILTCGLVAGDEESYTVFKDLFDNVISARHNGYAPDAVHPTNMDPSKLSDTPIEPEGMEGKYVKTTRCRTGRSVRGIPLPPCCSFEQRRELEKVIVKGLNALTGELQGKYYGLNGSKSVDSIGEVAMDEVKEELLRTSGNLFQEPDSTLLLSSGCGRHWPDARGIFHNDQQNFFVWVNEEDHIRIVSMQKGAAIKEIFTRFANATQQIEEVLKGQGTQFMHSDHLGYILTCPSNLGTGLRAGAMVTVPLFSAREDFKKTLDKMKMQARGTAGVDSASKGGTWDISNADRLGTSEVELCNIFIEGIAQVIKWEIKLEGGEELPDEKIEEDIAAYWEKVKSLNA